MDISLAGRRALVCGASQGIGEATARELATLGATVHLLARSSEKLKNIVEELPGTGHDFTAIDFAHREQLAESVESLVKGAPIEILVCNTGGPKGGPISDAEEVEFLEAMSQHVLVNALLVKKLLPGMKTREYGRVINVISTSVKMPIPNLGVSNTIRGAVANWAKTLSLELASFGITVNNVLPGYTETPRLQSLLEGAAARTSSTFEEVSELWKKKVPAGRFGKASEVASAVAFLASPAASYINGINLPVDGGRTGCL